MRLSEQNTYTGSTTVREGMLTDAILQQGSASGQDSNSWYLTCKREGSPGGDEGKNEVVYLIWTQPEVLWTDPPPVDDPVD
ncbi:hypothetical protein V8N76_003973 [Salmonella enterica]